MIRKNKRLISCFQSRLFCSKKENNKTFEKVDNKFNIERIDKLAQIKMEEEEESAQQKYSEFFTKQIKDQEAVRRKDDRQAYDIINKGSVTIDSLKKIVLQRNFFNRKTKSENSEITKDLKENINQLNREIDMEILEKINIKEPVALYEIDLHNFNNYKSLDKILKAYFLFSVFF